MYHLFPAETLIRYINYESQPCFHRLINAVK